MNVRVFRKNIGNADQHFSRNSLSVWSERIRLWSEREENVKKEICKWPNQNLFFLICRWSRKRKIKHKFQGQASSRSPVSAKTDAFTFVLDSARTLRLHLATLLQSGYSLGCIRTVLTFHNPIVRVLQLTCQTAVCSESVQRTKCWKIFGCYVQ